MKKLSMLALSLFITCFMFAQYVDLGLPSRTKWKNTNEHGYFTFEDALRKYGNSIPTEEQWNELKALCVWKWEDNGCMIIGPNKKSLFLPFEGFINTNGLLFNDDTAGYYWSSTPGASSDFYTSFYFYDNIIDFSEFLHSRKLSIRLVYKD